jgi:hypothetical protein
MRTRSLVVGYFHPIFLTNSDTPQPAEPAGSLVDLLSRRNYGPGLMHPGDGEHARRLNP